MTQSNVLTVEDLETRLSDIRGREQTLRETIRKGDRRIREIDAIVATAKRRVELDPIHDKYIKMYFGKKRFADKHKDELEEWKRCNRYLYARFAYAKCDTEALTRESAGLKSELQDKNKQLSPLVEELDMLCDIQWLVKDLLPDLEPEAKELPVEKKEEKRRNLTPKREEKKSSLTERLNEKKMLVQEREEQHTGKLLHSKKKHYDIGIE